MPKFTFGTIIANRKLIPKKECGIHETNWNLNIFIDIIINYTYGREASILHDRPRLDE